MIKNPITPIKPIFQTQPPNLKIQKLKNDGNIGRLLEIASAPDHPSYTQSLNSLIEIAFNPIHFKALEAIEGLRKLNLIENSALNDAEFKASMEELVENLTALETPALPTNRSHRILFPLLEEVSETTNALHVPPGKTKV